MTPIGVADGTNKSCTGFNSMDAVKSLCLLTPYCVGELCRDACRDRLPAVSVYFDGTENVPGVTGACHPWAYAHLLSMDNYQWIDIYHPFTVNNPSYNCFVAKQIVICLYMMMHAEQHAVTTMNSFNELTFWYPLQSATTCGTTDRKSSFVNTCCHHK